MPVSFGAIPSNVKVPLYWVEVDPSKAGQPTLGLRALLVGTMTADGTSDPDVLTAIGTQAAADEKFGQGSELARMFKAFFSNNFANEVWAGPVAEPTAGAAATATITVATPPTAPGTIHLYIGGQHIPVDVGGTDTVAEVATAMADEINDIWDLPVAAVAGTAPAGTVTLTCNWKGVGGNEIRVELSYFGQLGGELPVPGLVLTMPVTGFMTGGSGTPDCSNLIAAMGETEFEYVAVPWTDSTTMLDWEAEYGFSDSGRWGWQRQHFGHVFTAKRGTYSDLVLFGQSRNSGVVSVLAFEQTTPTPMYEMAAAYTAKAQRALVNDPARPLQTLQLAGTLPAPIHQRFNFVELNGLASNGLAIQKCWEGSGLPQIAREQTTYRLNPYGVPDDAYELVTTLATLAKVLRNQRNAVTNVFGRAKLANDGARFGPGQVIATPNLVRSHLIAQYRADEFNGLVENTGAFVQYLIVERDPNDPNRLNVLYPPDLINQLRVFAVLAQFRLQFDRGIDAEITGFTGLAGVAGPGSARAA